MTWHRRPDLIVSVVITEFDKVAYLLGVDGGVQGAQVTLTLGSFQQGDILFEYSSGVLDILLHVHSL